MFEWKVDDLKLYNNGGLVINGEKIYDCENHVSREDKIAFVDKMNDDKLSYILKLGEKYQAEESSMPKDKFGNVRTLSFKAWIKRNDINNLIDIDYNYGRIRFLGKRNIASLNEHSSGIYEDYVDEVFHVQLKKCEELERKYFLEHDEYSILKNELKKQIEKHRTTFGVQISICSSGQIYVSSNNSKEDAEREITIDEIKYLLSKYEELNLLIKKITDETKSGHWKQS